MIRYLTNKIDDPDKDQGSESWANAGRKLIFFKNVKQLHHEVPSHLICIIEFPKNNSKGLAKHRRLW